MLELYDIADGKAEPGDGRPDGGVLHGRVRAAQPAAPTGQAVGAGGVAADEGLDATRRDGGGGGRPTSAPRVSATCSPRCDLNRDKLYGHVKTTKNRTTFLAFCRYLRSLYPPEVRIAIVLDNFSPHLSTNKDQPGRRVGGGQQRRARLRADQRLVPRTGSSAISRRCATSRSTAPTTAATTSRTR